MTRARYTPRELKRLKLGWAIRQRETQAAIDGKNTGSASANRQRRKIQSNHQAESQRHLEELRKN